MVKIIHGCSFEALHLPREVTVLVKTRRCDICGQMWVMTKGHGSLNYRRIEFFGVNVRKIRWRRRMKKEMKK